MDTDEVENPNEDTQAKTADQKKQQAALGKLGDDSREGSAVNSEKAKAAMNALTTKSKTIDEAKETKRKALMAVKVEPGDIDFISVELEVSREEAELALRENNGVVVSAIKALAH